MNEGSFKRTIFGTIVIVILTSNFLLFSADVSLGQLIVMYLFIPVSADESWDFNIHGVTNPGNHFPVSTEAENEDDTEFNCSKILETCPDQAEDQTNIPAT